MSVGHRRVDRWLLRGIEFCIVTHVAALGAMALVLRPGLDVVGSSVPERAAAVASAPTLWRLGWACWQITAASD